MTLPGQVLLQPASVSIMRSKKHDVPVFFFMCWLAMFDVFKEKKYMVVG